MTAETIRIIAACDGFDCSVCGKNCGLGYAPRHRENDMAKEYFKMAKKSYAPPKDCDLLLLFETLQNLETIAEIGCREITRQEREHIAGTLEMLRRKYDECVQTIRKEAI